VDESSNEGQNSIPEQSCQSHESVKEIDGYGQPDKNTNTGDDDNLCFISSKSFQRARNKDTKQQKHYFATKNASQAPLSFWPRWAYEMYDSYSLSRRAAGTKLFLCSFLFLLNCSKLNLCYSAFIDC
jgi:hypothetical protein